VEEKQETKKQPEPKREFTVTVIERKGKLALVQWLDGDDLRRAYVPANKVVGNRCDEDTLKVGIPYGVPWEALIQVEIDPAAIANELRKQGVWTARDLEMKPRALRQAVDRVTGLTPGALRRSAVQYEKGAKK
jgi:hypothetical protein